MGLPRQEGPELAQTLLRAGSVFEGPTCSSCVGSLFLLKGQVAGVSYRRVGPQQWEDVHPLACLCDVFSWFSYQIDNDGAILRGPGAWEPRDPF